MSLPIFRRQLAATGSITRQSTSLLSQVRKLTTDSVVDSSSAPSFTETLEAVKTKLEPYTYSHQYKVLVYRSKHWDYLRNDVVKDQYKRVLEPKVFPGLPSKLEIKQLVNSMESKEDLKQVYKTFRQIVKHTPTSLGSDPLSLVARTCAKKGLFSDYLCLFMYDKALQPIYTSESKRELLRLLSLRSTVKKNKLLFAQKFVKWVHTLKPSTLQEHLLVIFTFAKVKEASSSEINLKLQQQMMDHLNTSINAVATENWLSEYNPSEVKDIALKFDEVDLKLGLEGLEVCQELELVNEKLIDSVQSALSKVQAQLEFRDITSIKENYIQEAIDGFNSEKQVAEVAEESSA
ncbi:hypothetical protein NADFUDRAFT_42801 [Nadsonia fulvescens var. elongata DSM 6958]|uniref:Uncharacterized protein n=1 Tax=Nadsonia fulvescens var. elongata DSM 6958 TaxID=857566 RepID=A0A1E3PGI2_9ASCO|nr:hypothetical protein NADFUDRAFT_42801 [Nadsonia fulvescens var. elongata DSM 6958]